MADVKEVGSSGRCGHDRHDGARARGADPEALELAVRGIEAFRRRRPDANRAAVALLTDALERDPTSLGAAVHLGRAHYLNAYYLWGDDWVHDADNVRGAAERCLRLEPAHAAGHLLLALFYTLEGRAEQGLTVLRSLPAVAAPPEVECLLGQLLALCGRTADALRRLQRALALTAGKRPSAELWFGLAMGYFVEGRYAKAVACAERAAELCPALVSSRICIAAGAGQLGDRARAGSALAGAGPRLHDFASSPFRRMLRSSPADVERRLLGGLELAGFE